MERVKQIWTQLEANISDVSGLFKVRYSETSKCDVFLGLKSPERRRMLILKVPFTIGKEFIFRYDFKSLKFLKIYDPDDPKSILLILKLDDNLFQDVFDSLIIDVLSAILDEYNIKIALKNFSNRLIKWRSLFEMYNPHGLSAEEQRGLFGELYLLRKLLLATGFKSPVVQAWVGCENQVRDFQYNSWSIEVKTTQGNNQQRLHINGERQLDPSNLENLFLYHISLETRQNSGETLNDIVKSVRNVLQHDLAILNLFNAKLIEAKYYEQHVQLYSSPGYIIRQDVFYRVQGNFPRIEEKDIRSGVGDLKYSIIISQASEYILSEKEIFKHLDFK